jgi:hypothetical protein
MSKDVDKVCPSCGKKHDGYFRECTFCRTLSN